MYVKQHTLKEAVSVEGVGLHTGVQSRLTFRPAPEHHGYIFQRVDLPGQPCVRADLDNVSLLERSTTLSEHGATVHTVEHVLAALAGMQIDNVLIELDGPEPPALDGSALPFVERIRESGSLKQEANREFFVIDEPIHYHDQPHQIDLAALEYDSFSLTVMIEYPSDFLGVQYATMKNIAEFPTEIAPNRTFCFWHELEPLIQAELIKGGSLDNALVIVDREVSQTEKQAMAQHFGLKQIDIPQSGILNRTPLHFANEPARHKLLDLIGDLALIGAPLKGQIVALRPGHASNVAFARLIRSRIQQKKIIRKYQQNSSADNVVFDIEAIKRILPHRYPFLLVDRITSFTPEKIEGIKNITINEPFFNGHFEGNAVMPAVLQLEAMAQVGGILLLNSIDNPEDHWVYFVGVDKARFKRPVVPGDQLLFKLEMLSFRRNVCKIHGRAFVGEQMVCEAEMIASLVNKHTT